MFFFFLKKKLCILYGISYNEKQFFSSVNEHRNNRKFRARTWLKIKKEMTRTKFILKHCEYVLNMIINMIQ